MKRILTKLFIFILGLGFFAGGGYLCTIGYAHSSSNIYKAKIKNIPRSREVVQLVKKQINFLPRDIQEHLQLNKYGMLIPLGGAGGLLAFIGLVLMLNAMFRLKSTGDTHTKQRDEDANRISDDLIKISKAETSSGEFFEIDESILDVEEDQFEVFRDINNLVTMKQSKIEPEDCERIVTMFRPDLLPFLPTTFSDQSLDRLAHQILESIIYRHQRQKKDITADQFQAQDKRISDVERETFLRRYMPAKEKINSSEMEECVGKVYDTVNQAVIQKQFLSEADDWVDISLRNAVDTLSVPIPTLEE